MNLKILRFKQRDAQPFGWNPYQAGDYEPEEIYLFILPGEIEIRTYEGENYGYHTWDVYRKGTPEYTATLKMIRLMFLKGLIKKIGNMETKPKRRIKEVD